MSDSELSKAERQNTLSGSIAVRVIIMLYKEAFEASGHVDELYGQVLAFSVSHDNDKVVLYGHFAIVKSLSDELQFYRYPIDLFSLTVNDGADRYKAYNFVCNIYGKFAPIHRQSIKDAVKQLPIPSERTGLSFAASDMSRDESDSRQDWTESKEQLAKLHQQLDQQRDDQRCRIEQLKRQMERQEKQMKREKEQLDDQRLQVRELMNLLKKQIIDN